MLRSIDGGENWEPVQVGDGRSPPVAGENPTVQSIACRTETSCLATVGEPWSYTLITTNDSGLTWEADPLPGGGAVSTARVACESDGVCLLGTTVYDPALETFGAVHRSTDGVDWLPVDLGVPPAAFVNFHCAAGTCLAAGSLTNGEAVVLSSTDGAVTWQQHAGLATADSGLRVAGITCARAQSCAVMLSDSLGYWQVKTAAGETWDAIDGPSGRVTGIACDDAATCLITGSPKQGGNPPILLRGAL
jgi:hypothetical protein